MADRNIVTYEEDRNDDGPHWTLEIDRSAAGQPGLFFTIKTEMHSARDKMIEPLNRELTVVAKDGVALLAPVLQWLLTQELVEEIVKSEAAKDGVDWDFLPSENKALAMDIGRRAIEAFIRVGQQRLDGQYKVGV